MTDHPRLFRPVNATFDEAYRQYHGHGLVTFALRLTDFFLRDTHGAAPILRTRSQNERDPGVRVDGKRSVTGVE